MLRAAGLGAMAGLILLPGCEEKPREVEVTETRELTTEDQGTPRLDATSTERFEGGRPMAAPAPDKMSSPVTPAGWTKVEATSMRLVNYTFGPQGEGEVYLSRSMGGIPANVVRWAGQFGNQVTTEEIAGLAPARLGDAEGVLVEFEGTYSPGFGRPAVEGQALLGIVAEKAGVIWTLKMTGPAELVAGEKERLLQFAAAVDLPE